MERAAVDSGVGRAGDYSASVGRDAKDRGIKGIGEPDYIVETVEDMRW